MLRIGFHFNTTIHGCESDYGASGKTHENIFIK